MNSFYSHSKLHFKSLSLADFVEVWSLCWIIKNVHNIKLVVSAEVHFQSVHVALEPTWSLNLGKDLRLDNMTHCHVGSVAD